jgi:hypothetical protein
MKTMADAINRAEAARVLVLAFGEHIAPTRMTRLKNPYR